MRIGYESIEGLTCPFFFCSICGEKITDGPMSMIAWDMDKEPGAELHAVHKGKCLHRLEHSIEKVDGGHLGTNELSYFVANLMENSGYDMGPASNYEGMGTSYETDSGRPRRPFEPKKR